jgi:lipoyl(octanoyl) transferase
MDDLSPKAMCDDIIYKNLGNLNYSEALDAMRVFTHKRTALTPDEIWFCEHPPVFTYGKFGDLSHILNPQDIPVIPTDRGGQVTYHGPGQLMIYMLIDLRRRKIGIKQWVSFIENLILLLLKDFDISGERIPEKPGIYVENQKICSIGLRVTHGCCYHGAALNLDMDLGPFTQINPCGYPNQPITDLARLLDDTERATLSTEIIIQKLMSMISDGLKNYTR